jgi:hypothetical protein
MITFITIATYMPLEIRIIRSKDRNPVANLGQLPAPLCTYSNKFYPESIGLLEIGENRLYAVGRTWLIDARPGKVCEFRQVLQPHHALGWHDPLYLFGALVNEEPKEVMLHFGIDGDDQKVRLAFIPRLENDVIEWNGKCYQCHQVIFKKSAVVVQVDPSGLEVAEIEKEFYLGDNF